MSDIDTAAADSLKALDLEWPIREADITRVIHEEPAFAELFIAHLLVRNSRVEEDLVDQLFNSSEKRLARILLLLANFGKEGRPEPIIAKTGLPLVVVDPNGIWNPVWGELYRSTGSRDGRVNEITPGSGVM